MDRDTVVSVVVFGAILGLYYTAGVLRDRAIRKWTKNLVDNAMAAAKKDLPADAVQA